jgi:hypothetical protein
MAKVVFVVQPYPSLITSNIRDDFEAFMDLLKRLNHILQFGLEPNLICPENDGVREVQDSRSYLRSALQPYLRHYHSTSTTYDVTSFFRKQEHQLEEPFSAGNLISVFAYGNILEFVFKEISIEDFVRRTSNFDVMLKQLFNSPVSRKMYEMYLGHEILASPAKNEFFMPPYLTVYLAVLVTESTEEFRKSVNELKKREVVLNVILPDSVAIGSYPATNFIHEPFFNININPVLINLQNAGDYKMKDSFGSMWYLTAAIGEFHNILALMSDVHELCAISRSSVPTKLYEKIGVLRINPLRDLVGLYGLNDFRKYDKLFRLLLAEDVNYFQSYNTEDSKIIWRKESEPHFVGLVEVWNLIDTFLVHLPENTIFKDAKKKAGFAAEIYKQFEHDFKGFLKTLSEWVKDVTQVIEGARTTVQLNVAIITLFWTLALTILLSQDLRSWLTSLLSHLRNLKTPNLP